MTAMEYVPAAVRSKKMQLYTAAAVALLSGQVGGITPRESALCWVGLTALTLIAYAVEDAGKGKTALQLRPKKKRRQKKRRRRR